MRSAHLTSLVFCVCSACSLEETSTHILFDENVQVDSVRCEGNDLIITANSCDTPPHDVSSCQLGLGRGGRIEICGVVNTSSVQDKCGQESFTCWPTTGCNTVYKSVKDVPATRMQLGARWVVFDGKGNCHLESE